VACSTVKVSLNATATAGCSWSSCLGSGQVTPCLSRRVLCLLAPSDSTLRRTPLVFGHTVPTAGSVRDFHPLEVRPAGRTHKKPGSFRSRVLPSSVEEMVRMDGLEPSCLAAHAPQTCVSTNFTTSAVRT
jgi:hypothetical protein